METDILQNRFEQMGARMKLRRFPDAANWNERRVEPARDGGRILRIDVGRDAKGEFFDVLAEHGLALDVIDHRPRERHLLLLSRNTGFKDKFLCGHDERHWFVAAVPDGKPVTNVRTAMEALKPNIVRVTEQRARVAYEDRFRRKNAAFVRQGEWFFVPAPQMARLIDPRRILKKEPLSRGVGSKPHLCELVYRAGGETVYVCGRFPQGVTELRYKEILHRDSGARRWGWQTMRLNPEAYAKGWVSHADHATIYLNGWHRIVMNTENEARAMKHVVFLD